MTGSEDKTVRVWELPSGRLLSVLRPPVGEGNEGKLYAAAISPDGKTVACGGWTGLGSEIGYTIYLFDRATGELSGRIEGLQDGIDHLSFSPDGAFLAAALGVTNGIRVFRTSDGALIGEDRDYGTDSYAIVFDRDNRIAASSFDGYVRLYDPTGGRRPETDCQKTGTGREPSFFARLLPGRETPRSRFF